MGPTERISALLVFTLLAAVPSVARITLKRVKTVYLPFAFTPEPQFEFDQSAADKIAYDSARKLVFAVGNANLFVLDAGPTMQLDVLAQTEVAGPRTFSDVAFCGGYIFTCMTTDDNKFTGAVKIFSYDEASKMISLEQSVTVGSQPKMLTTTRDCRTVLVALEGNAFVNSMDGIVDPEGGIGLVTWDPSAPAVTPQYREADFKAFNAQVVDLVVKGIRFAYRENGNTLSQDLEPLYISLSDDETLAYITLQTNNAIALLDISDVNNPVFRDLYPAGTKDWGQFGLDPSDADGGINIAQWPILGALQPASALVFRHNGEEYIATTNEGSPKVYDGSRGTLFTEVKTGKMFAAENLIDDSVSPVLRSALGDDRRLGKLEFSTVTGSDPTTGKFQRFTSFGGRSFSIIRTRDMNLVFDSGSMLERSIARELPIFFNTKPVADKMRVELFENRSPIRGPEPESMAIGKLNGKTVMFIGSENPGTISVFSMASNSLTPQFESVFSGAEVRQGETWADVYAGRRAGDQEPEEIIFSPATENSMERPMIFVAAEQSGTVTAYEVLDDDEMPDVTSGVTSRTQKPPTSRFLKPMRRRQPKGPSRPTSKASKGTKSRSEIRRVVSGRRQPKGPSRPTSKASKGTKSRSEIRRVVSGRARPSSNTRKTTRTRYTLPRNVWVGYREGSRYYRYSHASRSKSRSASPSRPQTYYDASKSRKPDY